MTDSLNYHTCESQKTHVDLFDTGFAKLKSYADSYENTISYVNKKWQVMYVNLLIYERSKSVVVCFEYQQEHSRMKSASFCQRNAFCLCLSFPQNF